MYFYGIPIYWTKEIKKIIYKKEKFTEEEINMVKNEIKSFLELIELVCLRYNQPYETYQLYEKSSLLDELRFPISYISKF